MDEAVANASDGPEQHFAGQTCSHLAIKEAGSLHRSAFEIVVSAQKFAQPLLLLPRN